MGLFSTCELNTDLGNTYSKREVDTKFYAVNPKSMTVGRGIDQNNWSAGTLYFEKAGRIVYVSGELRLKNAAINGKEYNVCNPSAIGDDFLPFSGMHGFIGLVVGSGSKICYVKYITDQKTLRLLNQSGSDIAAGSYVQITGSYICY